MLIGIAINLTGRAQAGDWLAADDAHNNKGGVGEITLKKLREREREGERKKRRGKLSPSPPLWL